MIAFGHTAVGSLVGLAGYSYFGNSDPVLGLGLTAGAGIVSHYLVDLIPHGHFFKGVKNEFKNNILAVIIFDVAVSIGLFLWLGYLKFGLNMQFLYLLFGIGGSQLPDVLDGLIYTKFLPKVGLIKLENNFHQSTHWHGKEEKTLLLGVRDLWQLSVAILAAIWLIKY